MGTCLNTKSGLQDLQDHAKLRRLPFLNPLLEATHCFVDSFGPRISMKCWPESQLNRTLTDFSATLIGIGAIIGAGIFATIGTAASGTADRAGAGPSLMLSFVITAIVCGFTALCYAELASMVPISGSAYTFSYA